MYLLILFPVIFPIDPGFHFHCKFNDTFLWYILMVHSIWKCITEMELSISKTHPGDNWRPTNWFKWVWSRAFQLFLNHENYNNRHSSMPFIKLRILGGINTSMAALFEGIISWVCGDLRWLICSSLLFSPGKKNHTLVLF